MIAKYRIHILVALAAVAGGAAYYFLVWKKKKEDETNGAAKPAKAVAAVKAQTAETVPVKQS